MGLSSQKVIVPKMRFGKYQIPDIANVIVGPLGSTIFAKEASGPKWAKGPSGSQAYVIGPRAQVGPRSAVTRYTEQV